MRPDPCDGRRLLRCYGGVALYFVSQFDEQQLS